METTENAVVEEVVNAVEEAVPAAVEVSTQVKTGGKAGWIVTGVALGSLITVGVIKGIRWVRARKAEEAIVGEHAYEDNYDDNYDAKEDSSEEA